MKYTCVIIDDEQPARSLLKEYVGKLPDLVLIKDFRNGLNAIDFLSKESFDILFLDIQMPGITGIELVKTLRNKPQIILTTAYSEYAVEGFELDVCDYLVKPFSFERFVRAVNKSINALQDRPSKNNPEPTKGKDYLVVKADHQLHRILYEDLIYIEGMKEYVRFHLQEKTIMTLESLKSLELLLEEYGFMRIHKSFIINTKHVSSLYGNQIILKEVKLPIGKSYRNDVIPKLF